jgi:type II secretion system protein N
MVRKQLNDTELSDDIYISSSLPIAKIVIIGLVAMFLGFLLNYPLATSIENSVRAQILNNPTCPIQTQGFSFRAFPPKLSMSNVQISGVCFQNPMSSVQFNKVDFSLARPSFYPIGGLFRAEVSSQYDSLKVDLGVGIPSPKFRIHRSTIDTETLNALTGTGGLLRGSFTVEGQGGLNWAFDLNSLSMIVRSSNLVIPAQNVQGLQLPTMNFGNALLKLRMTESTTLNVEELVVGSDTSPLTASLSGSLELDPRFFGTSEINFLTDLFLAEDLMNSFPIVNLFLGSHALEDGHFRFRLTGPLNSPRFSRP